MQGGGPVMERPHESCCSLLVIAAVYYLISEPTRNESAMESMDVALWPWLGTFDKLLKPFPRIY
jgi:hypothetical protein